MNLFDKFLFWLTMRAVPWYRKMDVQIPLLKAILKAKLIMDDRRPAGLYKGYQKEASATSGSTGITIFISLIMGLVFLCFFAFDDDITRLTFYYSLFVFMLTMLLIVNFTNVLIDIRDNYILLPKPVNAATLLLARILHIFIYISKIAIPMLLPGVIAIGISRGIWGSVIFIPISILVVIFTIFLVNLFYLMIIKIMKPEKFNSIISSIQIGFSVLIFFLYQIIGKLMDQASINQFNIGHKLYLWLLPPYWFAVAWKFFTTLSLESQLLSGALVSIGLTLLSVWIVIHYFAPAFQQKLYLISTNTSGDVSTKYSEKKFLKKKKSFSVFLAKLFTRPGADRAGFLFTWKMMARSRDFKMAVYPYLAYMAIAIILPIITPIYKSTFSDSSFKIPDIKLIFIIFTYSSCMLFFNSLIWIPYSDKFRSAWVFFAMPIKSPGKILIGTTKACFLKFCAPLLILVYILSPIISGPSIFPNIIFGLSNILLFCSIISLFMLKEFPFSVSKQNMESTELILLGVFMMILLAICAVPHYFLFDYPKLILVLSLFTFTASLLVFRSLAQMSWKDMKQERMMEEPGN